MSLLSFLNPLSQIVGAAERAHERVLSAKNNSERIQAEQERDFWRGRVEAVNASIHDPWWSPRTLMGMGVALYVLKIIVWDTVLGLGVTPDPGSNVSSIVNTVISFYFVSRAADQLAGVLMRKRG